MGFEANGGFLLGGTARSADGHQLPELTTRDAMLPIVAVLAAARDQGSVSGLVGGLPARATSSDRLQDVPDGVSGPLLAALAADAGVRSEFLGGLSAGEVTGVDTLDGVRMTLASGDIVHLRMSGNAPELRCYGEGASPERADWLVAQVLERVARRLG